MKDSQEIHPYIQFLIDNTESVHHAFVILGVIAFILTAVGFGLHGIKKIRDTFARPKRIAGEEDEEEEDPKTK